MFYLRQILRLPEGKEVSTQAKGLMRDTRGVGGDTWGQREVWGGGGEASVSGPRWDSRQQGSDIHRTRTQRSDLQSGGGWMGRTTSENFLLNLEATAGSARAGKCSRPSKTPALL